MNITPELKDMIKRKVGEKNNKYKSEFQELTKTQKKELKVYEELEEKFWLAREKLRAKYPHSKFNENKIYFADTTSSRSNISYARKQTTNKNHLHYNDVIAKLQYMDSIEGKDVVEAIMLGNFEDL